MEMIQAKKTILMKNPSILCLSAYQLLKLSFFLFSEILASFCTHFRHLTPKIHEGPDRSPHKRCPVVLETLFHLNGKG